MRMLEEEDATRAPVAETPLLGSHFEPEHEHEEETPQSKGRAVPPITLGNGEQKGSVPPPPNTFSEAEALRWPAIREALSDETRSSVGQGLAVRVVRGYAAASDTPPKVAEVLEKTVAWRREYDVDAALTKPAPAWEARQRLWPCVVHGTDENGRLGRGFASDLGAWTSPNSWKRSHFHTGRYEEEPGPDPGNCGSSASARRKNMARPTARARPRL